MKLLFKSICKIFKGVGQRQGRFNFSVFRVRLKIKCCLLSKFFPLCGTDRIALGNFLGMARIPGQAPALQPRHVFLPATALFVVPLKVGHSASRECFLSFIKNVTSQWSNESGSGADLSLPGLAVALHTLSRGIRAHCSTMRLSNRGIFWPSAPIQSSFVPGRSPACRRNARYFEKLFFVSSGGFPAGPYKKNSLADDAKFSQFWRLKMLLLFFYR